MVQAIQVFLLDSVPNDLVIPWGFGCVAAAGMGVGTMFGSQRMTTTVGTSPVKRGLQPSLLLCHLLGSCHVSSGNAW